MLIEASYQLNTNAQKLILCCVSKIDSRKGAMETNKEMTISTLEYEAMTGVSNARRELYKAADALFDSAITIKNDKEEVKLHWIQKSVKKHKGDGAITIRWTEDILEYLTQLEVRFTSYKLANITNLNSAHAIRLYELLIKWKSTGELVIFVNDFKEALGISDKYNEYKSLNQWVIQPSLKELRKSDLDIKFIPIKKGKKIEALGFQFKEKEQLSLPI